MDPRTKELYRTVLHLHRLGLSFADARAQAGIAGLRYFPEFASEVRCFVHRGGWNATVRFQQLLDRKGIS